MENGWFVVQVFSGHEKKIKRVLEEGLKDSGVKDQIDEILLPTENVIEVKGGEQKISEKKLWPGYLLIKMAFTEESWMYVKNVNGVISFLGADKPVPLTEHEVNNILKELADKKDTITQKQVFSVGDKIKIIDGVFINFMGTITEVNNEKGLVNVMVAIFDRDTPVNDLEFWQVELITDDNNSYYDNSDNDEDGYSEEDNNTDNLLRLLEKNREYLMKGDYSLLKGIIDLYALDESQGDLPESSTEDSEVPGEIQELLSCIEV